MASKPTTAQRAAAFVHKRAVGRVIERAGDGLRGGIVFSHADLVAYSRDLIDATARRVRREALTIVEETGKQMAREHAASTAPAGFLCSATAGQMLIALKAHWRTKERT